MCFCGLRCFVRLIRDNVKTVCQLLVSRLVSSSTFFFSLELICVVIYGAQRLNKKYKKEFEK